MDALIQWIITKGGLMRGVDFKIENELSMVPDLAKLVLITILLVKMNEQ